MRGKNRNMFSNLQATQKATSFVRGLVFFFLAFLFLAPSCFGQTKTLRVGIYQNSPKAFIDEHGVPKGIFVDIIDAIARKEKWKVKYVDGTWAENIQRLENGKIDLLMDVSFSIERAKKFTFNNTPVLESWLEVFSMKDLRIGSIVELNRKKIAVLEGAVQEQYLRNEIKKSFNIDFTLLTFSDYPKTIEAVKSGVADVMVASRFFSFSPSRDEEIVPSNVIFRPENLFIAFPKNRNPGLIRIIDGRLAAMKNDPDSAYYQSLHRWLNVQPRAVVPGYIKYTLIVITALLIGIGLFAYMLKRQVASKTKALTQSIREKETLIRELYHRTKNTLQLVRSMLALQTLEYPTNFELQKVVKNTEQRIEAISLVHQMLYNTRNLSEISMKEYIHELSALIMDGFGVGPDRISLNIQVDDQCFLLDTAIPFGLILNELMTNSLKYAFPEMQKGMISISLTSKEPDKSILLYSDNGVGVPDGFDFRNQKTLGLQSIFSIGEHQMLGKVMMKSDHGFSCLFEFPNNLYKARV